MKQKLLQQLNVVEGALALAWRTYLFFRGFFALKFPRNFGDMKRRFWILRMFNSCAKFWSTNQVHYLDSSLSLYWRLRGDWESNSNQDRAREFVISGWGGPETGRILKSLEAKSISRKFRPDVWYLTNGRLPLWCGFEALISEESYKANRTRLQGMVQVASQHQFKEGIGLKVESFRISDSGTNLAASEVFLLNPHLMSRLVEASCDGEVADLILRDLNMKSNALGGSHLEQPVGRLLLLSSNAEKESTLIGWERMPILSPSWIHAEVTGATKDPTLDFRVTSKYSVETNLKVSNGGILCSGGSFLDWDRAQLPALDFVAGHQGLVIGTTANLQECLVRKLPRGREIEKGIVLSSRVDSNWFHFLIETLPRLFYVENEVDKSYPVIVSTRVPRSGLAALRIVTNRKVIRVNAASETTVQKAVIPGPAIFHPDSQFFWDSVGESLINLKALSLLRDRVLSRIRISQTPLRVFFHRSSNHRNLINSDRISRVMSNLGFEIQDPGELSFQAQVRSVGAAKTLVIVGGAAMANFVFARPNSNIIVLTSRYASTYPIPRLLGKLSGSEVKMISGKPRVVSKNIGFLSKLHSSFKVNPRALRQNIQLVEKSTT